MESLQFHKEIKTKKNKLGNQEMKFMLQQEI